MLLSGQQGGQFSVTAKAAFQPGPEALTMERGVGVGPPPRACVLGGVAGCPEQGSMEPRGVAADEGRQGFHILPGTALWSCHDAVLITPPFSPRCLVVADESCGHLIYSPS